MASMELINDKCGEPDCAARATTRILDKSGAVVAVTCTKHARAALIAASHDEQVAKDRKEAGRA